MTSLNAFYGEHPILLLILFLWVLPWKLYSLWLAVKNNRKGWFVALVILNTAGILEIIYIFAVAKKTWPEVWRAFLKAIGIRKNKSN
jgi:hypothetical protein